MQWKIYYDDGTTYSDEDGSHYDAPNKGVVCIACKKQNATLHLHDWYYWHDGLKLWWCSDIHGLLYQLRNDRDGRIRSVMIAANVDTPVYRMYIERAYEERTS